MWHASLKSSAALPGGLADHPRVSRGLFFAMALVVALTGTLVHRTDAGSRIRSQRDLEIMEGQELRKLAGSTGFPSDEGHHCNWDGVSCKRSRVTKIVWSDKQLTGEIPDLNLPNLWYLNLKSNEFTGDIPKFNNLPKLAVLKLEHNKLSGEIPNFNLPKLYKLDLGHNDLTGEIPNFNLPKLRELWLNYNELTGDIPVFDNLPVLAVLHLEHNELTGEILNFNLPELRKLRLEHNELTGEIPNFNFPELIHLFLGHNELTGEIPNFNLPKLRELRLEHNELTGEIPNFNLPELRDLYLGHNELTGEIPNFNLPKLFDFHAEGNQLPGLPEAPKDLKVFVSDECPICLEDFIKNDKLVVSECGHTLHHDCWRRLVVPSVRTRCPQCRNDMPHNKMYSFIAKELERTSEADAESASEVKALREPDSTVEEDIGRDSLRFLRKTAWDFPTIPVLSTQDDSLPSKQIVKSMK